MEFKFFKPYESMYVDSKLPEIAEIRRQRYDENAANYDALQQKIASLRLEGDDVLLKDALQSDIDKLVSGNIGFENMDRTITAANQRVYEDTDLMDAMDTAATRRAELEGIDKLTASGKEVLRFDQTPRLVDPNDPSLGYEVGPDGKFVMDDKINNQYTPSDGKYQIQAEERKDPLTAINTIVSGIARDPIVLQNLSMYPGLDPITAAYYLLSGDKLESDKIYELSDNMMKEFIVTESGLQMKRELMEIARNPETGMLYTEEEAEARIAELMYNSAAKQEGKTFQYSVNGYAKWALDNAAPPVEDKDDFLDTTYAGETLAATSGLSYETDTQEVADWFAPHFNDADDSFTGTGTAGPTGGDITNAGARVIAKKLDEKGGFGQFNESDFENNRDDIVRYIFDRADGLGKLRDRDQFKDMNDRQFAKSMIDAIRTTPEKFDLNLEAENKKIVYQDIWSDIMTKGTITINGESFNMGNAAGRDGFMDQIKESDFSPGMSYDDNEWEKIAIAQVNEQGYIEYDAGSTAKITTSFSVTGADAGEFRFIIKGPDIEPTDGPQSGTNQLEFTYQLTKDQTKGFQLIKEIYSALDAKNPKGSRVKIVDKATSKMIFGTDKEYSYKVEPVHDKSTGVTAFAPVFYVGNSKVSMPDPSDPSKRKAVDGMSIMKVIIQRAIKGMKAGKSNILTATTEDIRPTRSTTTP